MSKETVGSVLKKARLAKGLTQVELAEQAGVHINTYARVERDEQEPSFDTIRRLTSVLGIKLEDIPS